MRTHHRRWRGRTCHRHGAPAGRHRGRRSSRLTRASTVRSARTSRCHPTGSPPWPRSARSDRAALTASRRAATSCATRTATSLAMLPLGIAPGRPDAALTMKRSRLAPRLADEADAARDPGRVRSATRRGHGHEPRPASSPPSRMARPSGADLLDRRRWRPLVGPPGHRPRRAGRSLRRAHQLRGAHARRRACHARPRARDVAAHLRPPGLLRYSRRRPAATSSGSSTCPAPRSRRDERTRPTDATWQDLARRPVRRRRRSGRRPHPGRRPGTGRRQHLRPRPRRRHGTATGSSSSASGARAGPELRPGRLDGDRGRRACSRRPCAIGHRS